MWTLSATVYLGLYGCRGRLVAYSQRNLSRNAYLTGFTAYGRQSPKEQIEKKNAAVSSKCFKLFFEVGTGGAVNSQQLKPTSDLEFLNNFRYRADPRFGNAKETFSSRTTTDRSFRSICACYRSTLRRRQSCRSNHVCRVVDH